MKIATKNQLSLTDLEQIPGTGRGGRVTKKDVLFYIDENKKSEPIFRKISQMNLSKKVKSYQ